MPARLYVWGLLLTLCCATTAAPRLPQQPSRSVWTTTQKTDLPTASLKSSTGTEFG
jgi:hypothetical protein